MPQKISYSPEGAVKELEKIIGRDLFDVEATKNNEEIIVTVTHRDYQIIVRKIFRTRLSKVKRLITLIKRQYEWFISAILTSPYDLDFEVKIPSTNILVFDKKSKRLEIYAADEKDTYVKK